MKKRTTSLLNNTSYLYVAVAVILIMAGILFATRSSLFTVRDINVEGLQLIDEDEITALLGAVQGENLFLLDTDALAHKVQLHPLVEQAAFERRLPHTLVIKVAERNPLAMILAENQLFEVDGSGTVLRYYDIWPDIHCPVLTGIQVQEAAGPGQKIKDEALAKALACLADVPAELKTQIDEIHVESSTGSIKIYMDTQVEVRLGISDNYAGKLQTLAELIKSDERMKSVRYIDLTSSKYVIK